MMKKDFSEQQGNNRITTISITPQINDKYLNISLDRTV